MTKISMSRFGKRNSDKMIYNKHIRTVANGERNVGGVYKWTG